MTTLQQIAIKWTERKAALGLKGRKADQAVFEFFIGAATALRAVDHPEAMRIEWLSACVLSTAPFPCGTVAGWATGGQRPEVAETIASLALEDRKGLKGMEAVIARLP